MTTVAEESNASDEEPLIVAADDDVFYAESFDFPWFLINAIQKPREFFGQNSDLFQPQPFFDRLLWRSAVLAFVGSIVFGIAFGHDCYYAQILSPLATIHGSCGLIIIAIHSLVLIFSWKSTNMVHHSRNSRLAVKLIFLLQNILVATCIIAFLLGHVCIAAGQWLHFRNLNQCGSSSSSDLAAKLLGAIILALHYVLGVAYLCNRSWKNPLFLHWLKNLIQSRIDGYSASDKIVENENAADVERLSV